MDVSVVRFMNRSIIKIVRHYFSSYYSYFPGIGIIDFESWRPVFRQNFGTLKPYQDLSYDIERKSHPFWPEQWVKNEASLINYQTKFQNDVFVSTSSYHFQATRRFEESAVPFMRETLKMAKEARPLAKWGYYAYPYCFNMNGNNKNPSCPENVVDENNRFAEFKIVIEFVRFVEISPTLIERDDTDCSNRLAQLRFQLTSRQSGSNVRGIYIYYNSYKYLFFSET